MISIFSADHALRNPKTELYGGQLVRPHECPERAEIVLERIRTVGLGEVAAPAQHGLAPILRVHDAGFVEFLSTAWADWLAAGNLGEAIPDCWPARRMAQRRPHSITASRSCRATPPITSRRGSACSIRGSKQPLRRHSGSNTLPVPAFVCTSCATMPVASGKLVDRGNSRRKKNWCTPFREHRRHLTEDTASAIDEGNVAVHRLSPHMSGDRSNSGRRIRGS